MPTSRGDADHRWLSIREYLASHAPAEPGKWFTPAMPPRPLFPALPSYGGVWTRAMIDRINQWRTDDAGVDPIDFFSQTDQLSPEQHLAIMDYGQSYHDASRAMYEWDREMAKQRSAQWPWAWADAVLEARSSATS